LQAELEERVEVTDAVADAVVPGQHREIAGPHDTYRYSDIGPPPSSAAIRRMDSAARPSASAIATAASTIRSLVSPCSATRTGRALLNVLWIWTGVMGYRAARRRRYAEHRRWMIRNFALTLGAIASRR